MYQFSSRVRFSEVDRDLKLKLHSVLNYFQDCSTFHSESTHMAIEEMTAMGFAWVLASWQVVVNRLPRLGEEITIKTWPYSFKGFYGFRNFLIEDADGSVCAYANTTWTFINIHTMHPARIPQEVQDAYPCSPQHPMENTPRKISVTGETIPGTPQTVVRYHIDTNDHVNNSMYVLMAQELLPEDFQIRQMRAEYKNAAKLGDQIFPSYVETNDLFQVLLKDADGNTYAIIEFTRRSLCSD